MNHIFIITGVNQEKLQNFLTSGELDPICEDDTHKYLKIEILDTYPQTKDELDSIPFVQGIEKI